MSITSFDPNPVRTIGAKGRRVWLYPLRSPGRFVRARTAVAWTLLAALLVAPWLDIGGHAAMHFDFPSRRFHFWGLTFFATDANYLLFLFGAVIFSIFLFTAVFGRVWCGWLCPQTVFMESIIRPIEELIEGPPSKRRKLDAGPWSGERIIKKGLKWAAFLGVAGMTATTLVAYFLGRGGVMEAQISPGSHPVGTAFFVVITAVLVFDFTWFREQTCVVVCPYGRFQSVLMDADSLTVSYDVKRGEPRGKPARPVGEGAPATPLGDCVDCKKCVQVCPTGIDIREGVQLECVACTACIDACDGIMDKLGRPRGLIRYATENGLQGKPRRLLRPRVVAYALALTAVLIGFATAVTLRVPFEARLSRAVGMPFVELPDGRIQNVLELRLSNKTGAPQTYTVRLEAPEGAQLEAPLGAFHVESSVVRRFPLLVRVSAPSAKSLPLRLVVEDALGQLQHVSATFMAADRAVVTPEGT